MPYIETIGIYASVRNPDGTGRAWCSRFGDPVEQVRILANNSVMESLFSIMNPEQRAKANKIISESRAKLVAERESKHEAENVG